MTDKQFHAEGRGRSARKRAAKAVEELAQRLVELPDADLAKLPLSHRLAEELHTARNTRGHGSRKRQIKYLAGLLRRDEQQQQQLSAALTEVEEVHGNDVRLFHHLEDLRDRLCDQATFAAALEETGARYPRTDIQRLAGLARSVHDGGDKKAFREIFRQLRQAEEDTA